MGSKAGKLHRGESSKNKNLIPQNFLYQDLEAVLEGRIHWSQFLTMGAHEEMPLFLLMVDKRAGHCEPGI